MNKKNFAGLSYQMKGPTTPIDVVFFNGCTGLTHAFEVLENGQVSVESLCGFELDDCDDLASIPGPHMRECATCERVRLGSFLDDSGDDDASGDTDGQAYS